ncbi:MAG: DUF6273 domain-containing protein [Coriobacteriia bacterium]|nr:DUF6273 domain-containing protein [Coriobacteriia bacterium]
MTTTNNANEYVLPPEKAEIEQWLSEQCGYGWLVLDIVEGDRALAITKLCVTTMAYYDGDDEAITWADSKLRAWLNGEFYANLPAAVQARVPEVTNLNPDNVEHGTPGGNPTSDRVFALSTDEATNSSLDDETRPGLYNDVPYPWWLRSPGASPDYAALVDWEGTIYGYGSYVDAPNCGVRPAMWVKLG